MFKNLTPTSKKLVRIKATIKDEQAERRDIEIKNRRKKVKGLVLWSICGIIIALFLLSCLVPFVPSDRFWPLSMLGIIFPWLLTAVVAIFLVLLINKSRWSIAAVLALLCSWKVSSVTFGTTISPPLIPEIAAPGNIRLLSWNVYRWDEMRNRQPGTVSNRASMVNAVLSYNADILCFHEFFEPSGRSLKKFESNIETFRAAGFPYYIFFATSAIHESTKKFGMAIFSKYPIVDSATVSFGKAVHSEGLMFADLKVKNQIVRFYSTHLESFRLGKSNYLGKGGAGLIGDTKSSLSVIKGAYGTREAQTALVKKHLDESPYPVVFCANLGDVPNSETYFRVGKNLKDGFLEKSNGFGKTFNSMIPNLRLDYIMVDRRINVENFYISPVGYSDHYPLVSDLHITENETKN